MLSDQLLIGQRLGLDEPEQCVPEQERVLAVVESEREFTDVSLYPAAQVQPTSEPTQGTRGSPGSPARHRWQDHALSLPAD